MAYLRPDTSESVMIPSLYDPLEIEARVQLPTRAEADGGDVFFVIAHPYGPMGGNMHSNVVAALHEYAAGLGYGTVRFNFRGVGRTGGSTSNSGEDEEGDLRSVIRWLLYHEAYTGPRPKRIVLVGYSYGAMVTASVAHEAYPKGVFSPTPSTAQNSTPVIGWIGISYPFGVLDRITLYSGTLVLQNAAKYKGPKLIIAGTADDFVKGYEEGLLPRLDKAKLQVETVDGMNHFWEGSEQEIISRVEPWLKGVVGLDVRKPAGNGAEARL